MPEWQLAEWQNGNGVQFQSPFGTVRLAQTMFWLVLCLMLVTSASCAMPSVADLLLGVQDALRRVNSIPFTDESTNRRIATYLWARPTRCDSDYTSAFLGCFVFASYGVVFNTGLLPSYFGGFEVGSRKLGERWIDSPLTGKQASALWNTSNTYSLVTTEGVARWQAARLDTAVVTQISAANGLNASEYQFVQLWTQFIERDVLSAFNTSVTLASGMIATTQAVVSSTTSSTVGNSATVASGTTASTAPPSATASSDCESDVSNGVALAQCLQSSSPMCLSATPQGAAICSCFVAVRKCAQSLNCALGDDAVTSCKAGQCSDCAAQQSSSNLATTAATGTQASSSSILAAGTAFFFCAFCILLML